MPRFSASMLIAISALLVLPAPVWAHAHLKQAEPADHAQVSTTSAVKLTFSEGLNLAFSGIKLTGPAMQQVTLGQPALSNDGKTLSASPAGKLAPGSYQLDWHVLSVDGHKTKGTYHITVTP
jgi:methionine-rich copper-binding protein CopC